jgi:hypothetical protein
VIYTSITADLKKTGCGAPITDKLIAVITLFIGVILGHQISTQNAVTALRCEATCGARIGAVGVAVVAVFTSLPQGAITATSRCASGQTFIGIRVVPIITAFSILNNAITTQRWATGVTRVGGVVVPIITPLTGS